MPRGRPTKYTREIEERVCQLIRVGVAVPVAAQATGIAPATFYNWQTSRPAFRDAVQQARADAEAILVGRIQKASQAGSWRAACWLLERQWPERWAPASERAKVTEALDRELDQILADKE